MPRLSDTMTEGVIAEWHKKVGDPVKKGDLLAEIETDKATMELESYKDGTLLHIGTDKGGKLQVNDLLAIIGEKGEDISGLLKAPAQKTAAPAEKSGNEKKDKATPDKKSAPQPQAQTQSQSQPQSQPQQSKTAEQKSSVDISKMEEVVLMPRLSDTMTEGVIAAWHKNVGDMVKKGDLLAEIETDKATMDLESYKDGKLLHIGAKQGEKIAVNELLAIIGDEKKIDVNAIVAAAGSQHASANGGASQKTSTQEKMQASSQTAEQTEKKEDEHEEESGSSQENGRVKASPLAKKLAADKGIDISKIHGTGDGGRITKADIDNYKPPEKKADAPASEKTKPAVALNIPSVTGKEGYTDKANSQIRNIIAKRLVESKFSAPHFYLTMEINMDNAISSRSQMNELSPVKISFQDMIIKASAMALRQHPAVNSSWMGDFIRTYQHIHIGSAVAIP